MALPRALDDAAAKDSDGAPEGPICRALKANEIRPKIASAVTELRFGIFTLDTANRVLRRGEDAVALQPKVFACIELLASRSGELTTLERLQEELWPNVRVARGALRRLINEARKALGDTGDAQGFIRTRKRLGYVFVKPVETVKVPAAHRGTEREQNNQASEDSDRALTRLEQVDPEVRRVLEYAAVLGVEFDISVLAVLVRSSRDIYELLQPAICARLLEFVDEGRRAARFSPPLLQEALYGQLTAELARQYHEAAFAAWECAPEGVHKTGAVARHAYLSGTAVPRHRAQRLCETAGSDALSRGALAEAQLHLGRAVELAKQAPPSTRKTALALQYARALWESDEPRTRVCKAFELAADWARACGDPVLLGEAALGCALGEESVAGLHAAAWRPDEIALLEEAFHGLDASNHDLRHRIARALCWMRVSTGDRAGGQEAVWLAAQNPPTTETGDHVLTKGLRFIAASARRDREGARDANVAISALYPRADLRTRDRIEACIMAMAGWSTLGELEEYRAALQCLERLVGSLPRQAREGRLGERTSVYVALPFCARATLELIQGDFARARSWLTVGSERATEAGLARRGPGELSTVLLRLQVAGYQACSSELESWFAALSADWPTWHATLVRAEFAAERGDLAEAREHFERLRETDFRVPRRGRLLRPTAVTRARLADLCCALEERSAARALYDSLAHAAQFCAADGVLLNRGSISRPLGELASLLGLHESAREHLQCALEDNRRFGHRPETVKTRLALSRVLIHLEQTQAARDQLVAARVEAETLGMPPVLDDV